MIALLLKSQPDVGMLAVITAVFFVQLYINGLNLFLVAVAVVGFGFAGVGAYMFFPHVQKRVENFLHPGNTTGSDYQPHTALEAFGNGGLLGRGPGEGRVKDILPDAHADFVFAVAGEEFGLILCLVIIAVFAFIVLRGLLRLLKEQELFVVLSCTGLVDRLRAAGIHQHGIVAAAHPNQGHDAPVDFLWWFVCARRRTWHGHAAGTDATPASWRRAMRGPAVLPIVIAAGGTGGHFFPAEALASELLARGRRVALMTDARSGGYAKPGVRRASSSLSSAARELPVAGRCARARRWWRWLAACCRRDRSSRASTLRRWSASADIPVSLRCSPRA